MTAYWSQFSKTEIDSMHGIEPGEAGQILTSDAEGNYDWVDTDSDQDEDDTDSDQQSYGCSARSPCSNCMDCLGLSWRDFM